MAADEVIAALVAGLPVLLPTDTVYGLAASPAQERYAEGLYALKGREHGSPWRSSPRASSGCSRSYPS